MEKKKLRQDLWRILFCYKMCYYANLVCNLYIYDNYDWNLALNIFQENIFRTWI